MCVCVCACVCLSVGVMLIVDFVLLFAPGEQRALVGYRAKAPASGACMPPQRKGSRTDAWF